jgi:hypothetical protein
LVMLHAESALPNLSAIRGTQTPVWHTVDTGRTMSDTGDMDGDSWIFTVRMNQVPFDCLNKVFGQ